MVCFGGGLRWGEATALSSRDIDWARERVHVACTWSEKGGRIEPCKDGEDRWVKLPSATMAALRGHLEAMDLEGSVKDWRPPARELVFPNTVGRITRYGAFLELVWQPLLGASKLPYRKPHRHAPQLCDVAARGRGRPPAGQGPTRPREHRGDRRDLRAPRAKRRERRVDLDAVLGGVQPRPPASTHLDAGATTEGQLARFMREGTRLWERAAAGAAGGTSRRAQVSTWPRSARRIAWWAHRCAAS